MNQRDRQLADYDHMLKFVALGDSGVGKTSILLRFTDNTFDSKFGATVGIDFKEKRVNRDKKRFSIQFWDTAGQERFRGVATALFRSAMGFLLVFDLTNKQTFVNLRDWMEQIKTHSYKESPHIVLVGNKLDLAQRRMVTTAEAEELAEKFSMPYIECSAANGTKVDDAVYKLLDGVMRTIETNVPTPGDQSLYQLIPTPDPEIILDPEEAPEPGGCPC